MGSGATKPTNTESSKAQKNNEPSKAQKNNDSSKAQKPPPTKKSVQEKRHYSLSDFPTPDLLAYCQRKYHEDRRQPKHPGSDGLLPPFPPPTTKAQIFNPADYKHIDDYAQAAPLKLAAKSYEALVTYLIRPATNDIGKVRAFYVWIAAQRLQKVIDFIGQDVPSSDKPLFAVLLILGKQWGNGYSELFSNMCRQAKIPCQIVKGRVKGSGYRLGEKTKGTNDYCIVFVDGAWRFVDQHWGSQYTIAGVENDDWELIHDTGNDDGNDGGGRSTPNGKKETENGANVQGEGWDYICDDFYFLTDPQAIVYTHMTCNPALQLLARPVTEEEFWQMAYLKDAFFELEMTTVNQPKCILEADADGKIVFEFGLAAERRCAFSFALSKSTQDPSLNLVNGVTLDQFVMMQRSQGKLKILINFPKIGRFKFDLFGRDETTKIGFTTVCEYAIMCKKPNFDFEPYPENTRGEWGPGNDTEKVGLEPIDVEGGTLVAKDGKAQVRFHTNGSKNLLFQTKLKNPDDSTEKLDDCVCHYRTDEDVTFLMKLPRRDRYVFLIYAMDPQQDKSFRNICNYIVRSDEGCHDLAPYPPSDNKYGRTGDQAVKLADLRLMPQTHREAVIDPLNKDELSLAMATDKDVDLQAQMKRYFQQERETDCSQYVLYNRTKENLFNVQLNFPKVGFYKLNILSQKKIVYQYLINVQKPNAKCNPFPVVSTNWRSHYEVIEPKTGHLPVNHKVHFKVRIPEAKSVSVETGGISKDLVCKKKGSDIWEGDIQTPKEAGKLFVQYTADVTKDRVQPLLTYTVLGADEAEDVKKAQETAAKRADQLQKEIDDQRTAERKEADDLKKQELADLSRKEEDFKRNREKYERDEAMRQKTEDEAARVNQPQEDDDDLAKDEGRLDSADLLEMIQHKKQTTPEERLERRDHVPELMLRTSNGDRIDRGQRQEHRNYDQESHRFSDRSSEFRNASSRIHRVEGTEGWKKYHPRLVNSLALEKLRESIRTRDRTMLSLALDDCKSSGLQNNAEVKDASRTLLVIEARRSLQKACEEKDPAEMRNQIENIRASGLLRYLQEEVRETHYQLEFLERMPHGRQSILDMDKKTMSEIRRYHNPPPALHKVLQGAFLLLGEDEDTTDNWKECQRICNPQGPNGLTRKVLDFNINRVEPEMIERAKEILTKDVDITKVQTVGPGAGTFYVWAMGVIDEYEATQGTGENQKVRPANRERQKELLGRLQPTEPVKNRGYYKNLATTGLQPNQHASTARSPRDSRQNGDMQWRF